MGCGQRWSEVARVLSRGGGKSRVPSKNTEKLRKVVTIITRTPYRRVIPPPPVGMVRLQSIVVRTTALSHKQLEPSHAWQGDASLSYDRRDLHLAA